MDIAESAARLKEDMGQPYAQCAPLFKSEEEYRAFAARHAKTNMLSPEGADYAGRAYIGVDAGSTTIKAVALDEAGRILLQDYRSNEGSPVEHVKAFLSAFYAAYPRARVAGAAATGYGEELVKNAFRMDAGIVETMAHFTAARAFEPDVDFIIDIGGQDIKCFKIRGGAIDNIFKRSLFFGLRFVFAGLCLCVGYERGGIRGEGHPGRSAGGSRFALHGLYEFLGETGAKGRGFAGKHFCGPVHQRGEECAVQGHPHGERQRWAKKSWCRAARS